MTTVPPQNPHTVGEKTCSRCAETRPNTEFNRDRTRRDGLQSFCRSCQKTNYSRGNNAKKARERNLRYWAEHPEKKAAWRKVQYAIDTGKMTRGFCECGSEQAEAHHHKGYDNPLDVQWICRTCHINLEPRRGVA